MKNLLLRPPSNYGTQAIIFFLGGGGVAGGRVGFGISETLLSGGLIFR